MHYAPLVGLAIFCIMIVQSGRISRSAIKALSEEDKVRLVDAAGSRRSYGVLFVFVLVMAWYVFIQKFEVHQLMAYLVLMLVLLGFAIVAVTLAHRRMNQGGLPQNFRRAMITASILRLGGLFVLAISVLWPLLWHAD
jgi:hypothetical protein